MKCLSKYSRQAWALVFLTNVERHLYVLSYGLQFGKKENYNERRAK